MAFDNPVMNFVTGRRFRWVRHVVFILVGLLLAFKGDIDAPKNDRTDAEMNAILWVDAISFVVITGIIYLIVQVFVPKLLFRSRTLLFGLAFIISIVAIYLLVIVTDHLFLLPADKLDGRINLAHTEFSIVSFLQLCLVSAVLLGSVVGIKVFKKWIDDVRRMNEIQQINLKSELESLKSQVNPHFLFNTLNNLLVLTKTDPEKASQVLLGLSDLLRYQLYDSAKEKIILSKDIDFIRNLLALEKIRKDDFSYDIRVEGTTDGIVLPPFLFIPFVENAIKHGASSVGHCYLNILIRIRDQRLHFTAENSKPTVNKKEIGGIGLANIKRRLELLYPDQHSLMIKDEANKYSVNLSIPL